MTTFHLTVVTPDGCAFDGQAERVVCRAIDGDLAILAKHGDYCTALGMGEAHIVDADGQRRRADPHQQPAQPHQPFAFCALLHPAALPSPFFMLVFTVLYQ